MNEVIKNHDLLISKINTFNNTHPNITNFWINLLNIKKESYLNYFKTIHDNIGNLKNINDFTKEQLLLMFYII